MLFRDILMLAASQGGAAAAAGPANLIDNGTFTDASGWTLTGAAAISGGQLTVGAGTASRNTNATITAGNWYKVTYDIISGGVVLMSLGGADTGPINSAIGSYTIYLLAGSTQQFLISSANTIDNVVVTAVTATLSAEYIQNGGFADGTNWALSSTVTISGGTVNWSSSTSIKQAINTPAIAVEAATYYLTVFTLTARTTGAVLVVVGNQNGTSRTVPGTYSQAIYSVDTTAPTIRNSGTTTASADDFSVKKVTFS